MEPLSARERSRIQQLKVIQEAAMSLCLERGYQGFTMDDVAAATGLGRRTIFKRVGDKRSAVLGPDVAAPDRRMIADDDGSIPALDLVMEVAARAASLFALDRDFVRLLALQALVLEREPRLSVEMKRRTDRNARATAVRIQQVKGWPSEDRRVDILAALVSTITERAGQVAIDRVDDEGPSAFLAEVRAGVDAVKSLLEEHTDRASA